jgi:uncharacterized membrane protein YdjX (TVP38/TMEM64 family)
MADVTDAGRGDGAARSGGLLAPVLVFMLACGVTVVVADPARARNALLALLTWTDGLADRHMLLSMAGIAGAYVVACVIMLPGSILTLGAGFVLGALRGTVTVSVGSTLGACAAFLVGRTLARRWIEGRVARNPKFAAIDAAVGRAGFRIVLLTRLSPVFPFNMLNYGFGLTNVRFRHYALGSWIGMLPGTVMWVYLGSALGSLADVAAGNVEGGIAQKAFFWGGLMAAVIAAVIVARIARRALKEAVAETSGSTVAPVKEASADG